MCRKCHGALFASFSVYPKEAWSLTSGELTVFHSSEGVTRQFCGSCGCQILSTVASTPEVVYVTSGSLDPDAHPGHAAGEERHIYVEDKCFWTAPISDGLPQFAVI